MFEWICSTERIRVGQLVVGELENNVYLIACQASGKAVIVDAASEGAKLVSASADHSVEAILTTHGHFDHIGAVDYVKETLGIPFRMHAADAVVAGRSPDQAFADGDAIKIGNLDIKVLATPGHTPGSSCFLVEGLLFTGDTLFPGGPGATRFPYADFDEIIASIETRLFSLDDSTPFYPGHGASSTIGAERPSLAEWKERRW